MISRIEIDTILAPAYDELAKAAPAISTMSYGVIKRFIATVQRNARADVKARFPSLDDETVARVVDMMVARLEERIDVLSTIHRGR